MSGEYVSSWREPQWCNGLGNGTTLARSLIRIWCGRNTFLEQKLSCLPHHIREGDIQMWVEAVH